jgi:small subunit ribosomal protein S9
MELISMSAQAKTATKQSSTLKKSVAKVSKGAAPLHHGVGRRKEAVARVWLRLGEGKMTVNGRDYKEYFKTDVVRSIAKTPFAVCPIAAGYDVQANVRGGGQVGQADAIKLGFSRALLKSDEEQRKLLREHGLLTVDSRVKERKKPGQKGARRKFQFTKR